MRPPEGRGLRGTCAESEDATGMPSEGMNKVLEVSEALALKQRMQQTFWQ